ncbi:unnamed protein product [Gulo gulo]|uniref:Uncharacterized protein n=1 Tax=Gulo gulo TaxID=48420 RepID=A0A9X9LW56_GULGU|nr:unnamed protein product [Gulo gulo]
MLNPRNRPCDGQQRPPMNSKAPKARVSSVRTGTLSISSYPVSPVPGLA